MYPIILSIGQIPVFGFSIFLIVGFLTFSFLFWRKMREEGIDEEKIFDLMFYGAIASFIGARIVYIVLHRDDFFPFILRIFALWIAPGLSWTGALIFGIGVMLFLAKRYKIQAGLLLDAVSVALPYALLFGNIGTFLDGTFVGKLTDGPIGVRYIGHNGIRHPVQLYEIAILVIVIIIHTIIEKRFRGKRSSYGTTAMVFFLFYSVWQWILEFFRSPSVYLGSLSVYQWIMVAVYCESVGFILVKSQYFVTIKTVLKRIPRTIAGNVKGVYEQCIAAIHRRFTKKS